MPTSHDFDGTIRVPAPSTMVAGDLLVLTGNKQVLLALTAAASSASFTAKCEGLVKGVSKTASGDTWVAGADLTVVSGLTVAAATSSTIVNAFAYAATLTSDSTCDIIIISPARKGA